MYGKNINLYNLYYSLLCYGILKYDFLENLIVFFFRIFKIWWCYEKGSFVFYIFCSMFVFGCVGYFLLGVILARVKVGYRF